MNFTAHVVTSFDLTKSAEVSFYYDFFNGRIWANIRKFAKSDRYTGPTTDGVKFDPKFIPDIVAALEKADRQRDSMLDEEYLRLPKTKVRAFVVHASFYKGTLGIDLRETYRTAEGEERWGKGIRIRLEYLSELITALKLMGETKPSLTELGTPSGPHGASPTITKASNVEGVPADLARFFTQEESDA